VSAAHVAVREHTPVPLFIVTTLPATVHTPAAVITAVVLAFVVAETTKDVPKAAVTGAPVNVTVGVACATVYVTVLGAL
jgi:hypothetical protein